MMSENEILMAANKAKGTLNAIYALLNAIDQKTGYEQGAVDANARYQIIQQKELDAQKELEATQSELEAAKISVKESKKQAAKIISDADSQAETAKKDAKLEAGKIIDDARQRAKELDEAAASQSALVKAGIEEKRKELEELQSSIGKATTELNSIQGRIEDAKNEIRAKFLT